MVDKVVQIAYICGMAFAPEFSDFESAYSDLCSLKGVNTLTDGRIITITSERGGYRKGRYIQVNIKGGGEEQEFFISSGNGVFMSRWDSDQVPEPPKIQLLNGEEIDHPYVYFQYRESRRPGWGIFNPDLNSRASLDWSTKQEILKDCRKSGITLAQNIRALLDSVEKPDPIEYYI